jgi:hypothetical protein
VTVVDYFPGFLYICFKYSKFVKPQTEMSQKIFLG